MSRPADPDLRARLEAAGLAGSFLARDLASGDEIGIDPDTVLPVASLVKVPLAMTVLDLAARGELDLSAQVEVRPVHARPAPGPGPGGLSRFRHPARVAVDDLLHLAVAVSDTAAADVLLGIVPAAAVNRYLRDLGITGITVRHPLGDLAQTPAGRLDDADGHLALALAISGGTAGGGHPVGILDVSRASTGTARAFVELLQAVWERPGGQSRAATPVHGDVARRTRELLRQNVLRQRLAPDLASDAATWASKTGTVLNLRHEVGVVEHTDGECYAIAALTESKVPAVVQPAAEAVMGDVARELRDQLRGR